MDSNTIYYLENVLGVRSFVNAVTPPATVESETMASTIERGANIFYVLTPFQLSEGEAQFVKKILASINITEEKFTVKCVSESELMESGVESGASGFDQSSSDQSSVALAVTRAYGLCFGVRPAQQLPAHWLELPPLSKFLDSSNASEVTALKKKVWAQLKDFKSNMVEV
jgi:hypothetical protein